MLFFIDLVKSKGLKYNQLWFTFFDRQLKKIDKFLDSKLLNLHQLFSYIFRYVCQKNCYCE